MARKPNDETVTIPAAEVHSADAIVNRDGSLTLLDKAYTSDDQRVLVQTHGRTYKLALDRPVTVRVERECKCDGSGVHYGRGRVENGVFIGTVGECFGCGGKGFQNRSDTIRNDTYWRKYARIYA